jgi:hypothetical protein
MATSLVPPLSGLGAMLKMMKFGIVDNGLLVVMMMAGVNLDEWIGKKLGIPGGWGPLIGACIGNVLSDGVAGLADGWRDALGVTIGAVIPVIPVLFAAIFAKRSPEDKAVQKSLCAISIAMVAAAFFRRPSRLLKPA